MAAIPLHIRIDEYLTHTMHLTTEEYGAYLLLIMHYWQTGRAIPKDRLATIAQLSPDRWAQVEINLINLFTETPSGAWYHTRIECDLVKAGNKSQGTHQEARPTQKIKKHPKRKQMKGNA